MPILRHFQVTVIPLAMEQTIFLWIIALLLIVAGFAGLVIPALPGILLIFAGFVVGAWAENFVHVGWRILFVIGLLAALAYLLDAVAGVVGAKRFGAGKYGLAGAVVGTVFGMFFGLPGIVIGPFFGAFAGEVYARKDLHSAGLAGIGTWLGLVAGVAVKIAIAFAMTGVFIFSRLFLGS
jgi:uncharacterized protein YqgC (DUF456 family)